MDVRFCALWWHYHLQIVSDPKLPLDACSFGVTGMVLHTAANVQFVVYSTSCCDSDLLSLLFRSKSGRSCNPRQ